METEPGVGHVVGNRYELQAKLGAGGMATVYRAQDLRLGRTVAVKVYSGRADRLTRIRFGDEARTLAALSHPGLVAVLDAGTDPEAMYLVLDLIDGGSLGERLEDGPLPGGEVRRLGAALADALAYVHGRGVVHRDVKPANILLDRRLRPYLADFGICRLLSATKVTATGSFVGTPAYLAPEQAFGGAVTTAADVYALGLVLLECLTGRTEYRGTAVETTVARLYRPPVVSDQVPADLAAVITAMLQRDPARRPTAAVCARLLLDGPHPGGLDATAPAAAGSRRSWRLAAAGIATAGLVTWSLVAVSEHSGSVPGEPNAIVPPRTAHSEHQPAAAPDSVPAVAPAAVTQPLDLSGPVEGPAPAPTTRPAVGLHGEPNPVKAGQSRSNRPKG